MRAARDTFFQGLRWEERKITQLVVDMFEMFTTYLSGDTE